jgi:hypothetical protein
MKKWQKGIIDIFKSMVAGAGLVLLFFLSIGSYFGGSASIVVISENNLAKDLQVFLIVLVVFILIGFFARILAQKVEKMVK